ncbi:MAG: SpoIIE family protein phosphatase [Acidobacteriota bacterium]
MLLHLSDHSPEPLRSQIVRQLRTKILLGDLEPGALLQAAQPLARAHRVGVAPVAAALDELLAEGLVASEPDGGFRVTNLSAAQRRALDDQTLLTDPRRHELSLAELQLAREIQCRLLPPPVVLGEGFATVARCFPARFVAGDLYDVIPHRDGSVGVVVADVAGKGFAAALLMASVKAMTPFVAATASVEGTLGELNRRLAADLGPREFVALAYARYMPRDGTVILANAGMPDPLLLTAGQPPRAIEAPAPRLPLGLRPSLEYRSITFGLAPGERLLLYSDGLPEARLRSGDPLGYDAFTALVGATAWNATAADPVADSEAFLEAVLAAVQDRTGPTPTDDCTAVVLQHHEPRRTP